MTHHLLEAIQLGCTRGDRPLFSGLSIALDPAQLLHVSGSNGSGKTTLLRTFCTLSQPAAGEIHWNGTPISRLGDEYRAKIAYVGHNDGVHGELTPFENLHIAGCLSQLVEPETIVAALDRLGIGAVRDFPTKLLSQGQRRRLALARLLLVPKPLWILDEPFTALDALGCRIIETLLHKHLADGGTAIFSSHQELGLRDANVLRLDLDAFPMADIRRHQRTAGRAALTDFNLL